MKTLVKLSSIVAVAIFAAVQTQAGILANDSFSYPNGDLNIVSGHVWSNFSGTVALNVTNLSGNGLAVLTGANSKDDQLRFGGTHTNDVLFYGIDVDVTAWPLTVNGSYFALF